MSDNPWIEWKGGECPVATKARVDIKCRCGNVTRGQPADLWAGYPSDWWKHEPSIFGHDQDIIAYRLSGPSA